VHIKAGSPCPDGGTVQKIKVAGRGTYWCPSSQK
jgi:formamidopyrimidine-DNA glycosylase